MTDSKNDSLNLRQSTTVSRMINKVGDVNELVKYSNHVTKINKKGKEQRRAFLLTNRALYNLMPSNFKLKRRIPLNMIVGVTASCTSHEFVVHVPDEYDYRFKTPNKDAILDALSEEYAQIPGNGSRGLVHFTPDDDLTSHCYLKAQSRLLSREGRAKRRQALLDLLGQKDKEEEEREAKSDQTYSSIMEAGAGEQKVTLRDFRLIKVIGRGTFGKVMLVEKKDTGDHFAMKVLKKDFIIQRGQVDHTKTERALLQQMQHPFLMTLRYAFQTSSKLYFVLDFYQGGELFYHLKNVRRFSEACSKLYVAEIALALGYLHSLGVIYRDLKPENILLDPNGHVCLTDFGLAKEVASGEQTQSFCGTPEYLAPEIVSGSGHDKAADWWSLGILLYELTVGIPPFYSENVNEMYDKIQFGQLRFPPFLSNNCKSLIIGLLCREPADRLGSRDDVGDIKDHPFFSDLDWERLYNKGYTPDYQPEVQDNMAALFDDEFTAQKVAETMTMVAPSTIVRNTDFGGFTFAENKPAL